ncbi:MAG: VCBS repeat-containing protein [Deltaproteobacteria bacterium]|nr:VCBS repeat-containing protein [Nannocystaceae bacterium]
MPSRRRSLLRLLAIGGAAVPATASALEPFTDASDLLNGTNVSSGAPMAVVDMNADGLDDIVRLDDGEDLEIEYQQPDGTFTRLQWGTLPGDGAWGMAIADADNNGYPDVFAGGAYDGLKLLLANDDGTDYDLVTLGGPDIFVQCVNFADIDTDGAVDLFVCHDDGLSSAYAGDGAGVFTYDLELIRAETTVPSDDSGNYGTTWTDYDLDGDLDLYISKCRLFSNNPDDGRRLNLLFENDGDNNFTDVALERGVRPPAQSWSADFADIDNDGDMDAYLNTHVSSPVVDHQRSTLYENDGDNVFVDITDASGMLDDIDAIDVGIQTHFEDFDNDGFVDLLVTGASGEHRLFINNHDRTFTAEADPFPTGGPGVQSAVVGDLDSDGFPDVVAGFANGYNQPSGMSDRLFLNPGNDNNWINVRLTGVESNASGVGAMVELHGEWGVQRREVRAGESYGIVNSFTRHFGIGTENAIESVVINWPSGQVDTVLAPGINQTIHVTEGCPELFYADTDGDGFGDVATTTPGCIPPAGYVADATDCDDADGDNFPGNPEVCDEADNDCDGEIDEGFDGCSGTTSTSGSGSSGTTTMTADESSTGDGGTTTAGPTDPSTSTATSVTTVDPSTEDSSGTGDGTPARTTRAAAAAAPTARKASASTARDGSAARKSPASNGTAKAACRCIR